MIKITKRTHGFTLIEAVLVVLVISVTIPSGLRVVRAAERAQQESEIIYTATNLAASIGEQILADVYGVDRFGPAALDDPLLYLDDPTDGLRARVAWLFANPATSGMRFDIAFGVVGQAPAPAGMRLVTITVEVRSLWLGVRRMPFEIMVKGN